MYANISPIIPLIEDNNGNESLVYAFSAQCGENKKHFKSYNKTKSNRSRAKLIKRLKKDGFTVHL